MFPLIVVDSFQCLSNCLDLTPILFQWIYCLQSVKIGQYGYVFAEGLYYGVKISVVSLQYKIMYGLERSRRYKGNF